MRKTIMLIVGVLAVSACGGGSGSGTPEASANPTPVPTATPAPTPVPDVRDVFQRIGDGSLAQSGGKFSHEYFLLESDVLGDASSITYACDDPNIVTESDLRANGFGVTSNRVCLARGTSQDCYFPGPNALRRQINGEDTIENIIRLRSEETGEIANIDFGYSRPGRTRLNLVIHAAWSSDPACNDNSTASFAFGDINGTWDVTTYIINSFGAPAIEDSGRFTCAGTSCTGDSGLALSDLREDAEQNSQGLYYQADFAVAGGLYGDTQVIMSRSQNTLSIFACPNGVAFQDKLDTCRYAIAVRR